MSVSVNIRTGRSARVVFFVLVLVVVLLLVRVLVTVSVLVSVLVSASRCLRKKGCPGRALAVSRCVFCVQVPLLTQDPRKLRYMGQLLAHKALHPAAT